MFEQLLYLLTFNLFKTLGKLSPGMRDFCAKKLGKLVYRLNRHHRRIAIDNLCLAYGNQISKNKTHALAMQVFENLSRIIFEVAWAMHLDEKDFPRHFTLSGTENLHRADSQGKGVLVLLAHFGNWELLPIIAHMVGISVQIVYRPLDLSFADRFFAKTRSRFGAGLIATRTGAMQKIYRHLKRGYAVGMLMDQNEGWRKGVYAPFFGRMTCTNPGMAKLSLKSDAPVVPIFLIRKGHRFEAEFGQPLQPVRSGDQTRDIEENTRIYNLTIESYIRRYPEQWLWLHQRWKTPVMCRWPDPERRDTWYAKQKKRGQQ